MNNEVSKVLKILVPSLYINGLPNLSMSKVHRNVKFIVYTLGLYPFHIRRDLKRSNQHFVTLVVVLKEFQNNLFHMLHSLVRILWDPDVPLAGKGCFLLFITNFLIQVANQAKR